MTPYLQKLEFSYFDGEFFWDRSAELVRALRELSPGLRVTKSGADQRDLRGDEDRLEVFFGITAAGITSMKVGDQSFVPVATKFLGNLARIFEVKTLQAVSFRYILAQSCRTEAEALSLYAQLCGPGSKSERDWIGWDNESRARQFEYQLGPMEGLLRFAVLNLSENPGSGVPATPHVTAHIELRLPYPAPVLDFDSTAFMANFIEIFTKRVRSRLIPPEHEPANDQS